MARPHAHDPLERFREWFEEAQAKEGGDPTAAALATADARGRPSVRMVLVKHVDERGFVFYTNLESRKALDLRANPYAALVFHWRALARQVRIEGPVAQVGDEEADAYFATRPRGAQIGAWASAQSRPMKGRFELEREVAKFTAKFGVGHVPRPPFWSGFRIAPERIEFWSEGKFRLHDRTLYHRERDAWRVERLYP